MANFTLLISSAPFTSDRHHLALRFAREAARNHKILRVFFYGDAVFAANRNQQAPQGQQSLAEQWSQLSDEHQIPLICCIANSLRRGLADDTEMARYGLKDASLHHSFRLAGLGEMAEANLDSDRTVQF